MCRYCGRYCGYLSCAHYEKKCLMRTLPSQKERVSALISPQKAKKPDPIWVKSLGEGGFTGLSQGISPGQKRSRRSGSNRRPTDYKSVALPLRHAGMRRQKTVPGSPSLSSERHRRRLGGFWLCGEGGQSPSLLCTEYTRLGASRTSFLACFGEGKEVRGRKLSQELSWWGQRVAFTVLGSFGRDVEHRSPTSLNPA